MKLFKPPPLTNMHNAQPYGPMSYKLNYLLPSKLSQLANQKAEMWVIRYGDIAGQLQLGEGYAIIFAYYLLAYPNILD